MVYGLPEDSTVPPKHVGVKTERYFFNFDRIVLLCILVVLMSDL